MHALEPDLIILDEFQRFRHLLDPETGRRGRRARPPPLRVGRGPHPAAVRDPVQAVHPGRGGRRGRGPLLRPDDDADLPVLGRRAVAGPACGQAFADYRSAAARPAQDCDRVTAELCASLLLQYMCRTERPRVEGAHREIIDLRGRGHAAGPRRLRRPAPARAAPWAARVQVEYWKSAPYFVNFLDGYQVGERLKAHLKAGAASDGVTAALGRVSQLDDRRPQPLRASRPGQRAAPLARRQDRRRRLVEAAVDPAFPALPHPRGSVRRAVCRARDQAAGLLVVVCDTDGDRQPAELRGRPPARRQALTGSRATPPKPGATGDPPDLPRQRGRAGAMSTLALFWPHPTSRRDRRPARCSPASVREASMRRRRDQPAGRWQAAGRRGRRGSAGRRLLRLARAACQPISSGASAVELSQLMQGAEASTDEAPTTSVEPSQPRPARRGGARRRPEQRAGSEALADLALHGPGNIAWRALGRVIGRGRLRDRRRPVDSRRGHRQRTAVAVQPRREHACCSTSSTPGSTTGGQSLRYCQAGNLQAVLDEYLHHLRSSTG